MSFNSSSDRFVISDRKAVSDTGGSCTYRELDLASRSVARALLADSTSLSGERIGIFASPGKHFVASLVGIMRAGGCALVLSPLHSANESAFLCADAEVKRILVTGDLDEKLGIVRDGRSVIALESISGDIAAINLPRVDEVEPALQLYTSGTTGKPKGAILSHANLRVQGELLRDAWGFSESDVLLHALPLHHMHGLVIAMLTALASGAKVHFLPKFEAIATWEAMHECTVFMAVPTMYQRLFVAFDAADPATQARWSSHAKALRLATSGSAALPVTLGNRWKEITGRYPLERFGMTEIGVGTTNPLHGERKPGTVGKPLPSVETRIIREPGADSGELLIRGPSVFRGYYRREDANREAFIAAEDGGAPWFRTGDTVAVDADGYFKILGRTSIDILKSGGYKLSALEIEEVLRTHPAVLDAAVVGIADEAWGDRVVACVLARDGQESECTTAVLREFAREHLASYKLPKEVRLFTEFPRNAMGKVVKAELKALFTKTSD